MVSSVLLIGLALFCDPVAQQIIAFILILTFGILHGANDIALLSANKGNIQTTGWFAFIGYYLAFVATSFALFYFLPGLTLLLFIIFSGYHFGEQHWAAKVSSVSNTRLLFYTAYGVSILLLIFYSHASEVDAVIKTITGYQMPLNLYLYILLISFSATSLTAVLLTYKKILATNMFKQLFFIAVLFLAFKYTSLILSFAIYFVLWHSLPSLADQVVFLYGSINKENVLRYVKSSLPFWAISVTGLMLLLYYTRDNFSLLLPLFFTALAAITFPHIIIMSRLKKG